MNTAPSNTILVEAPEVAKEDPATKTQVISIMSLWTILFGRGKDNRRRARNHLNVWASHVLNINGVTSRKELRRAEADRYLQTLGELLRDMQKRSRPKSDVYF